MSRPSPGARSTTPTGMSLRARIADVDEATYGTIRRAYRDLMGTMPHDPTLFEVERLAVATRRPLAKDE